MSRVQLLPSTKRGLDTIWADYNEIMPNDTHDEKKAKLEQWIAKRIGTELMRVFNQREWKVMVDLEGGLLIIACDSLCNYKGYHIHMQKRTIGELIVKSIAAAGEILERHNASRSRKVDSVVFEELSRDRRDSVIAPDAAPEPI
jgi:hypothetical protein